MLAAIFGLSGLTLTDDERAFFKESDPAGYIIFGRNIADREQLRALTDSLRDLHGREDIAILIDQEGGRVSRMKEPVWPRFPSGVEFDRLYEIAPSSALAAARLNAEALGVALSEVGITVDCLPLLDVRQPDTTEAIGDRALGAEPMRVAALGRAILEGLSTGGAVGVVKHIPGHGRAQVDTHKLLPRVTASAEELEIDIAPFAALASAPMAMTAHIIYEAWDADRPATQSPTVIEDVIRHRIGFDGLLMSDDLDMEALSGTVPDRAELSVRAGCDLALNCWAKMDDMTGIAERVGDLPERGRERLARAMLTRSTGGANPRVLADLLAERDALLALAA